MNRRQRLEILWSIRANNAYDAVIHLATFWGMQEIFTPAVSAYNFGAVLKDLQHIENMREALQELILQLNYLEAGNRGQLEIADRKGIYFMQRQTEMTSLSILCPWQGDKDIDYLYHANVREWAYRLLSGDKTTEEVLQLCNELLVHIDKILA